MKLPTLLLSAVLLSTGQALANKFDRILPAQSQLSFVSRQMGVPVQGAFRRFDGRIAFDPARPDTAQATLEVDLASFDMGSQEVYDEVVGRNWFDVRQFPTARFVLTGLRHLGGDRYEVRGQMTLKGRTREVVAPFTYRLQGGNAILEGAFPLRRLDYGIGTGPWGDTSVVADEVQVRFRLIAAAAPPAAPGSRTRGKP
ncbi:MAG: YceI family protein [Thiobacillaceae bacterium]